MYKCRLCSNKIEKPFLSLGNSPLSNSYLDFEQLNKMEPFYPLSLYVCQECFLVQLDEFESHQNIFSDNYAYHSSFSETWLKHCKNYTEMIIKRLNLDNNSFVVEIASNDGYLLQYFKEKSIPVLGIEPAASTGQVAISKGINTDIAFFNTSYAAKMKDSNKLADLLIGNNVLAHNPELNDFVAALKTGLNKTGVITMEFPHILSLIDNNQFDTIYHEHYSYFSFHTVNKLFNQHYLEIFDVEELSTHGGSLRIYGKHKEDNSKEITSNVIKLLNKEKLSGILELKTYNNFSKKVEVAKRNLLNFLIKTKNEGKTIVGYGAPAKGNTLLNYCGIRTDFLDYTVDLSPYKQGKYLPGTHIEIKKPDQIKTDKPDYILILPWNIKDEIIGQLNYIREWNGKFIIPIPVLEII